MIITTALRRLPTARLLRAATQRSMQTDMRIASWNTDFVQNRENIGSFAALSQHFVEKMPKISPNLKLQFDLIKSPALLFRNTTAELIRMVEAEAALPQCQQMIVLDGDRGIGKSALMLQAASHFHNKDWIVISVPRLGEWISGIEPYEPTSAKDAYYQPLLAAKFLQQIVDLNEKHLRDIKIGDKSALEVAQAGINAPATAHATVVKIVDGILQAKDRKPVLFAFDQIGSLYRHTAYFDAESKPILASSLVLASYIQTLISKLGHPNTAILAATDKTESLVSSHYLASLLNSTSPSNKLLPSTIAVAEHDLTQCDAYQVELPSSMNRARNDLFSQTAPASVKPLRIAKFSVPEYNIAETGSVLDFYSQYDMIFTNESVNERFVAKQWMLTQGRPIDLLKTCISF